MFPKLETNSNVEPEIVFFPEQKCTNRKNLSSTNPTIYNGWKKNSVIKFFKNGSKWHKPATTGIYDRLALMKVSKT